jgi:hypothetical protein
MVRGAGRLWRRHTNTQAGGQADRKAGRQAGRQRDRQAGRQTGRQAGRRQTDYRQADKYSDRKQ